MLKEVTNDGGTGTMASVEGFDVAGKTGTAQKADLAHGGYAAKKRVGSFVGFVPANDPRLVVLVLVDEPEVNVYGGVVAAPVFRNIARGALRHLAVAPQKPDAVLSPVAQAAGAAFGSSPKKENNGASGAGAGSAPDFVGLSLREAVGKARSMKVKVQMHGNGYVIKQAPAPGGRWNEAGVLVLNLQG